MVARYFFVAPLLITSVLVGCGKKPDAPAPDSGQLAGPTKAPDATDDDKQRFEALKAKGAEVKPNQFVGGYRVTFGVKATDEDIKSVSGIKSVTALTLQYGHDLTNAGVKNITGLDHLDSLLIRTCPKLTGEGLANLDRFPNLTVLLLEDGEPDDAVLAGVSKLAHLKKLSVWSKSATDAGMVHVAKMATLEELEIPDCSVTDEGLKTLKAGLPQLKKLNAVRNKISNEAFEDFQKARPGVVLTR